MEEKVSGNEMVNKLRVQGVGWIVHMKPKVPENNNPGCKEDSESLVRIISDQRGMS